MSRAFSRTIGVAVYWPYHTKRAHDRARRLADQAVKNAIRRGELIRQDCQRCAAGDAPKRGRRGIIEAHHADYAKPLDVQWLCRRHHRQLHRELGARLPSPAEIAEVRTRENRSILKSCATARPLVFAVTTDILAAMGRSGITQSELARRLGVSKQQVNLYFNGGIRSLKTLAAVASACGLSVSIAIHRLNEELAS
jgi:DNA-binding XRE family transcriptional regulator